MKLPSSFKFKMGHPDDAGDLEVYRAVIDGSTAIISWGITSF